LYRTYRVDTGTDPHNYPKEFQVIYPSPGVAHMKGAEEKKIGRKESFLVENLKIL
jgi:hypothetical protein